MINILVPVYNEEKILEKNLILLNEFLKKRLKEYKIIILDSNSKDRTEEIAKKLSKKFKNIEYLNNKKRGKGIAIKEAALKIDSDFYSFIDIDLPIKLKEYLQIIKKIINKEVDVCVGSKYVQGSEYERPLKRTIASKGYNLIAKIFLNIPVKDIFMGVKVWNRKVNYTVWPLVNDEKWFFDIEFLYYAHQKEFKILEMPVTYKETRADSKLSFSNEGVYLGGRLFKFIVNHILT